MVEVQKKKEIPKSVISVLCEFEASFLYYGDQFFYFAKDELKVMQKRLCYYDPV